MLADREALVYEHKNQPAQSIPPLDALIIPKAALDCKAISDLLADYSDVFLFVTLYHSNARGVLVRIMRIMGFMRTMLK